MIIGYTKDAMIFFTLDTVVDGKKAEVRSMHTIEGTEMFIQQLQMAVNECKKHADLPAILKPVGAENDGNGNHPTGVPENSGIGGRSEP